MRGKIERTQADVDTAIDNQWCLSGSEHLIIARPDPRELRSRADVELLGAEYLIQHGVVAGPLSQPDGTDTVDFNGAESGRFIRHRPSFTTPRIIAAGLHRRR